jgi:hypothetical protein
MMEAEMRNPTAVIECGACRVPISPAIHVKPTTVISCAQCGAEGSFEEVFLECLADVQNRKRGGDKPGAWRFRLPEKK